MYTHKVQYYETDKMGITHHSNYIRWMEEARVDYMDKLGYGYERLEEEGIVSPVATIDCKYKKSTTFADVINIDTNIIEFNGVKLVIEYIMKNEAGEVVFEATSSHAFLSKEGRLIRIKNSNPEFYELLAKNVVSK